MGGAAVSAVAPQAGIDRLATIEDIVACSVRLGATQIGGPLSVSEQQQVAWSTGISLNRTLIEDVRLQILAGNDPLGDALTNLRTPAARRLQGAIYTPNPITRSMVGWALDKEISCLVDPGCGSGRFAAEAARRRPMLRIIGVDIDPVATLVCRAVLACIEHQNCLVVQTDYLTWAMPETDGRAGFVGNPPYVRHHDIAPATKEWGRAAASRLGVPWSGLAGLHVLFAVASALRMRHRDIMCLITSAEWLDVRYGAALRHMLATQPRLQAIHMLDPRASAFADTMTTATIFCAEQGAENPIAVARVLDEAADFGDLRGQDRSVLIRDMLSAGRWTALVRGTETQPDGIETVPLGSIARVSRGIATGANGYFVLPLEQAEALGLRDFVRPALTSAHEVFRADGVVRVTAKTKCVLDVPAALGEEARTHPALGRYLDEGEHRGVAARYLSKQRKYWWVLSPDVPPIVATYMARRPPAFALNPDGAAILNVVHGLYPRVSLTDTQLRGLVAYLNGLGTRLAGAGRTYHGGLQKFEPREMESIPVPSAERLADYGTETA